MTGPSSGSRTSPSRTSWRVRPRCAPRRRAADHVRTVGSPASDSSPSDGRFTRTFAAAPGRRRACQERRDLEVRRRVPIAASGKGLGVGDDLDARLDSTPAAPRSRPGRPPGAPSRALPCPRPSPSGSFIAAANRAYASESSSARRGTDPPVGARRPPPPRGARRGRRISADPRSATRPSPPATPRATPPPPTRCRRRARDRTMPAARRTRASVSVPERGREVSHARRL